MSRAKGMELPLCSAFIRLYWDSVLFHALQYTKNKLEQVGQKTTGRDGAAEPDLWMAVDGLELVQMQKGWVYEHITAASDA